jgi:hypothetical protein
MLRAKVVEEIKTQILCSIFFLYRVVYKVVGNVWYSQTGHTAHALCV